MLDLLMRADRYATRVSGSADPEAPSKHREKGLWSFLTWSFFISQALAAEELVGAPARAGSAPDDQAAGGDANAGQGLLGALPAPDAVGQADTTLPGQAVATYPVTAAGELPPVMLAGVPVDPSLAAALGLHEDPANVVHGGAFAAGGFSVSDPAGGYDGIPDLPGPGDILDPILDQIPPIVGIVDDVLDPVLDLLPPMIGVIDDLLDPVVDLLPPVIGAVDDLLDPVLDLLPPVIGAIDNLLDPVLDVLPPVVGAVGDVVADIAVPLVSTVGQVLTPVTGAVGDATQALEPVVDLLTSPVAGLVDDVAVPLGSVVGSLTSLLGQNDPDPEAASGPVALGSGSLDLEHALSAGDGLLNDLFTAGRYTDYNIALQAPAPEAVTAVPAAATGSTLISLLDHIVAPAGDAQDAHGDQVPAQAFALPSVLDDLALRGLGDGIAG